MFRSTVPAAVLSILTPAALDVSPPTATLVQDSSNWARSSISSLAPGTTEEGTLLRALFSFSDGQVQGVDRLTDADNCAKLGTAVLGAVPLLRLVWIGRVFEH